MSSKRPQVSIDSLPGGQTAKGHYRRPWVWRVGVCAVVLIIVAVVVPVAVILSRNHKSSNMARKANVIVPLYVYPGISAEDWNPLYQAANTSSALNFTVIVNPADGPGSDVLPDPNYVLGLAKLNSFPNVRTLGYVHTSWANRDVDLVLKDVDVYSNWAKNNSKLAVDGIFFDEAPWKYSSSNASYIQQIRSAVRAADGITEEKLIVFNPGTLPAGGTMYSSPDVVVAFEDTYEAYQQADLSALATNRTQYSFMVHTVPASANLNDLLSSMSQDADYLFVTDLAGHSDRDPYSSFSSIWASFIKDMPTA